MLFGVLKYPLLFSSGATLYRTFTLFTSLLAATNNMTAPSSPQSPTIRDRLAEYKPTVLRSDLSHLTAGDKQALVKLADVSDLLNGAYYRQIWSGASELRRELETRAKEETGPDTEARDRLRLFELLRGPWDRRRGNQPFIDTVGEKPGGANVYPEDMSKAEFSAWVATLGTGDEARRARGFYDIVVRKPNGGGLALARYADAYGAYLEPAARLMREAADLVSDPSFARFLRMRGESFGSNEYLESEVAWLGINSTSALEAAIGPYETYEDELFSAKAFFEAMVHVRDFDGTRMVGKFADSLEYIESRLPVPDAYRNPSLAAPPIVVVNQVYAGGDTAVPMTAAYNLPNDEAAIERGGSKLTMIRNVQEGKVHSVLLPIARAVLAPRDLADVTFDAFFTHVLLHEVAHSNGPHRVVGSPDTVRSRMQDLHSAFEEAKADITGLFAARLLVASGVIDNITMRQFYTTYLASAFRSVRFGLSEAHGLGQAMQLNYLLEAGGFVFDSAALTFAVDFDTIDGAVADLTRDIMLIQGDGDKARAAAFRDKYGVVAPSIAQALDRLAHVPIDIAPIWADIEELRKDSHA
ncbi:hypothetical protein IWW48_000587 [Coemansia sp. RSA 1200]|nr:hypothetical protein IWW48_000587 [Coemansia sp. RSA 1200]